MESVLLVIHLIVTIALIGLVLLQRSEGGGLGIGGGGGGMGSLAGAHTTANLLTRTTTYLAIAFFITNLSLAYLATSQTRHSDIMQQVSAEETTDSPIEIMAEPSDPEAGPKVPADTESPIAPEENETMQEAAPSAPVESDQAVPSAPIAE